MTALDHDYVTLPAAVRARIGSETGIAPPVVAKLLKILRDSGYRLQAPLPKCPESLVALIKIHDGAATVSFFGTRKAAELEARGLARIAHEYGEGFVRVTAAGRKAYLDWQVDGLSTAQTAALLAIAARGGWTEWEDRGSDRAVIFIYGGYGADPAPAATLTRAEFDDLGRRGLADGLTLVVPEDVAAALSAQTAKAA